MAQSGMLGFPRQVAVTDAATGFALLTAASGNWQWPEGVTAAVFWIQAGGGGGTDGSAGTAGIDSTVSYCGDTYTANGGAANPGSATTGGNGDVTFPGQPAASGVGGNSRLGAGGLLAAGVQGGGGYGASGGGGGGECVRVRITRQSGAHYVSYTVGTGGAGGSGTTYAGGAGLIFIEWTPPTKTA